MPHPAFCFDSPSPLDRLPLLNDSVAESGSGLRQVDGGKRELCICLAILVSFIMADSVPQQSPLVLFSRSLAHGSRSQRQGSVR